MFMIVHVSDAAARPRQDICRFALCALDYIGRRMEFFKFYKDKDRKEIEINNIFEFSYLLSPRQSRCESMYDVHNNDRNAAASRTRLVQLS